MVDQQIYIGFLGRQQLLGTEHCVQYYHHPKVIFLAYWGLIRSKSVPFRLEHGGTGVPLGYVVGEC